MSENDDSPQDDFDFQELEEKLNRLKPNAPSEDFLRRTGRRLDGLEQNRSEDKIVWMRFAPVAAAACVVLTSAFLLRDHLLQQQQQVSGSFEARESSNLDDAVSAGLSASVLRDHATSGPSDFETEGWVLPASTEFFLSDSEVGGNPGSWSNAIPARFSHFEFKNDSHLFEAPAIASIRTFTPSGEFSLSPR